MNLRTRLFKKPWQQKDPAARAEAVREQQDAELTAELPRLAQSDESAQVRLAALERIDTEPFWLDARLRESDPRILEAADRFLVRAVLRTDRPDLEPARLEWFETINASEPVRRIATQSPSLALRRAALARISAQGFLGDCFAAEPDATLAGEILARIDQASTLERISGALRGRNKRRAQAAAERLEQIRSAHGNGTRGQAASERLVHEAEALARGHFRGNPDQALQDLRTRWDAMEAHPEALTRRFEGAMNIAEAARRPAPARAVGDQAPAAPQAPEPDPPPDAQTMADASLAAAADHVRTRVRRAHDINPAELLATWDRAWNQLTEISPADEQLKNDILPLLRELQAQVQQKRARPEQHGTESGRPGAAPDTDFDQRLDDISMALEGGDIVRSDKLIGRLRSEFSRLPKNRRPAAVAGRLQRMEGRLKEMRNWQHWSNNQIRDEIIAQVEALPASGQHPDAVTAALKNARQEWKRLESLEVLPGDKRRFAAPSRQWRRFQNACKGAFEAAKPYFEQRDRIQQDNLATLGEFIDAGKAAAADPDSDTKTLLGFLRKARQAIRRMDDLPPAARGSSAAGLRELMDCLSSRLDERFDAIESTKRRLVTEARALAHEKDLKSAIEKAKALQSQWQQAGSGRRKVEQQLWREFREPIEPLFAQLKGEQTQLREADRQAHAALEELCVQAETLADLPEVELEAARGRLTGLIDQWLQHDVRPGRLNQRFEKAERRFEKRLQEVHDQIRNHQRERLWTLAETVQGLWERRCQGESGELSTDIPAGSDGDELSRALAAKAEQIAAAEHDPAGLAEAAEQGLVAARQVTVEMEFLSGLDTPAEDQKLRMDYQVQRLARRMSEREHQPDLKTEAAELRRRWIRSLPHPVAGHAELARRFNRARQVIDGMIGGN